MKLYVIGLGPGGAGEMTARARETLASCQVVAGYTYYIELVEELLEGKERIATGMKGEVARCRAAVEAAASGKRVAVISSGDAGVYGMAGLVCQLAEPHPELEIEVVPGVTAACSASAALGAPLTHDFATISLSDLLTEWELIERRLHMAAQGDFVIALYNPGSHSRRDHLAKACAILLEHLRPDTPCGVARSVGREEQSIELLTLEELARYEADMFTTIIVGNSATRVINGRLVTPRGYRL